MTRQGYKKLQTKKYKILEKSVDNVMLKWYNNDSESHRTGGAFGAVPS